MVNPLTKEEIRKFANLIVSGNKEAVEVQLRAGNDLPDALSETDLDKASNAYVAYVNDIRRIIGSTQ